MGFFHRTELDTNVDLFNFMIPDRMIGGILFLSCLFGVFWSIVNMNIRYNFLTVGDKNFIFGMHTKLTMPFQRPPKSMTL